jgi:transposase
MPRQRHVKHVPGRKTNVSGAQWLFQLLETITGVDRRSGEVILAELGPDMSVFPTDRHCASS